MGLVQSSTIHNRIAALMAHTTRYAFKGETRLATDAGVSKSAVCRLLSGKSRPSFALVTLVARALETHLVCRIDLRDLVSIDGAYPTRSACKLAGCRGCYPAFAYADDGTVKPECRSMKPGDWSLAPRKGGA